MTEFSQMIFEEMCKGNFSFAILVVGIIQVALMIAALCKKK